VNAKETNVYQNGYGTRSEINDEEVQLRQENGLHNGIMGERLLPLLKHPLNPAVCLHTIQTSNHRISNPQTVQRPPLCFCGSGHLVPLNCVSVRFHTSIIDNIEVIVLNCQSAKQHSGIIKPVARILPHSQPRGVDSWGDHPAVALEWSGGRWHGKEKNHRR